MNRGTYSKATEIRRNGTGVHILDTQELDNGQWVPYQLDSQELEMHELTRRRVEGNYGPLGGSEKIVSNHEEVEYDYTLIDEGTIQAPSGYMGYDNQVRSWHYEYDIPTTGAVTGLETKQQYYYNDNGNKYFPGSTYYYYYDDDFSDNKQPHNTDTSPTDWGSPDEDGQPKANGEVLSYIAAAVGGAVVDYFDPYELARGAGSVLTAAALGGETAADEQVEMTDEERIATAEPVPWWDDSGWDWLNPLAWSAGMGDDVGDFWSSVSLLNPERTANQREKALEQQGDPSRNHAGAQRLDYAEQMKHAENEVKVMKGAAERAIQFNAEALGGGFIVGGPKDAPETGGSKKSTKRFVELKKVETPQKVSKVKAPSGFSNFKFGQEVHEKFEKELLSQTGTEKKNWIFRTKKGQTGVDATYIGDKDLGFKHAELKPRSKNGVTTWWGQLMKWWNKSDVEPGDTSLWFYNEQGVIGQGHVIE